MAEHHQPKDKDQTAQQSLLLPGLNSWRLRIWRFEPCLKLLLERGISPQLYQLLWRHFKPFQEHCNNNEIQKEIQALWGKVILANPIGEIEEQKAEPDEAFICGDRRENHIHRPEINQVVENCLPPLIPQNG